MINIYRKTLKIIASRLFYLMIGIFLAVSFTYVYATWDQAKTGGSGQLGQSNWNALVNEVHNKCGSNCDAIATDATTANNILTENNWNSLADLLNNTLTDCAADNSGKCFINQTSKSTLDTDLVAGNIKSGINVFGVTGNYSGPSITDCTDNNGGQCYISQISKSALDTDLAAGNIKNGISIFGVTGTAKIRCKIGRNDLCWTDYCTLGTDCNVNCQHQWWYGCGYVNLFQLSTTAQSTGFSCKYLQMHECSVYTTYPCEPSNVVCEIY